MERGVHLSMKKHFCPNESFHEQRVGKYVADAFDGSTIFEIQTGSFSLLRKKIQYYLENTDHQVLVIRPLAKNKRILWLDAETGELAKKPRLSAKHETLISALPEIFYLHELLEHPRLKFCFPLLEISEVRLLDGYGKDKKKRSTSLDKLACELYDTPYICTAEDVERIVRPRLPDSFSNAELSHALRLKGRKLWAVGKLLTELGIVSSETKNRRIIFKFNK